MERENGAVVMSEWSIVVSEPADSALPGLLAARGLTVLAAPDLYDLPPGHLVFSAIEEMPGPVAVAAPYAPRATFWMLAGGGGSILQDTREGGC